MRRLLGGAITGAGVGLLIAGVDAWSGAAAMLRNNMSPPVPFMLRTLALSAGIGAALGALFSPLPPARHLAALTAIYVALELWVAPAGAFVRAVSAGTPLVAAGLVAASRRLLRGRPWLAASAALALAGGAVLVPWLAATVRVVPPPEPATRVTPPAGAPDVVVVVLDTVRADHVSAYGYRRPTTRNFDALARQGVLFLDAVSPATWSLPAHASLFTGQFPSTHGAHDEHRYLDDAAPTLAETLAAAGWDTRCFTANAWISDGLGLTRGFGWCDEAWREGALARGFSFVRRLVERFGWSAPDKGGGDVATHFERWIADRPPDDRPAFAFLNFVEAHFPYHQLPPEYLRHFTTRSHAELRRVSLALLADQFGWGAVDAEAVRAAAVDMYDGGVLYADMLLGRVMRAIRRHGTDDRTILVALSDHGELLGERGAFGHGDSLVEPMLRVPLAIRYPRRIRPGTRVGTPVSTAGMYATVLDLAGVKPPKTPHVASLLPTLTSEGARHPAVAEQFQRPATAASGDPLLRGGTRFRAYRTGTLKLFETVPGGVHLFDLAEDPAEARDLAADRQADVARLAAELDTWRAALAMPPLDAPVARGATPAVDPAAEERLKALGYVQGSPRNARGPE
jgi:arylsulfatase A-like enzyme